MSEPSDISRAVRVLMDASPEFRVAMERAGRTVAEAMEALDTPEMREALNAAGSALDALNQFQLEPSGAKVAEFEQATRQANGTVKPRLRSCVEAWPDCHTFGYNPACCRFPKSCSCTSYDDRYVKPGDLEPS